MEINVKKTNTLGEQILEVVSDIRLLGLVIGDDLSWTKNTDSIIK